MFDFLHFSQKTATECWYIFNKYQKCRSWSISLKDSACRSLIECLSCSTEDHGESKKCNPYVGYSYESFVNPDTDAKKIQENVHFIIP